MIEQRGESEREAAMLNDRARAIASSLERRGTASSAYLRAGAALLALARRSRADAMPLARERNWLALRASSPRSMANTLSTVIAAIRRKIATGIARG